MKFLFADVFCSPFFFFAVKGSVPTTESEYMAMKEVVKEVILIRQVGALVRPGMEKDCVTVMEGNYGHIKLTANLVSGHRMKRIDEQQPVALALLW